MCKAFRRRGVLPCLPGTRKNAGQAYILCAFAALPATGVLPLILGTPKADWLAEFPRLADLIALRPSEWFNPAIAPSAEALADRKSVV